MSKKTGVTFISKFRLIHYMIFFSDDIRTDYKLKIKHSAMRP